MHNKVSSLLVLLLVALPALADDAMAPLQVEADRWEADQTREISVFSGNVVLSKGSIHIEADEARIQATDGKVSFGTIIGKPARFRQQPENAPEINGRADRIEYNAEKQQVVLTGSAWVRQGNDEFSGESIHYDLEAGKVLASGNQKTPQRVRIVFTPRNADGDTDAESTDNPTPEQGETSEQDSEN